jgi:hypothetical protein
MDLQKLIARMDQIESRPSLQEALTLADVSAAEKQASDAAAAVKQKGGFASFTGWDPKTAGDIALSGLATKNGLPGLMNSKGEFVVAGDGQQKPKIAPPNGDDTKALQAAGLISGNAQGPSGLANFLSGGKAQQEFGVKKQDSMKTNATNTSNAMIKDIIPKITALLDKAEQEAGGVKETISFTSGIAKALAEGLGYNLKEGAMEELAPLMAQVADIEDPALKPLQDRYAALMNKPATGNKPADTSAAGGTPNSGSSYTGSIGNATNDPPSATPAAGTSTQGAEASAKFKAEKLARLKEITAKLQASASKAPGKGAGAAASESNAASLKAALAKVPASDPISANARPKEESRLSEAEKYAALRDRLLMIETRVDEGPLDFVKGAYNAGKGMFQAAKTGFSGAPVATGKLTKAGAAQTTSQGSKQFAKQLAKAPAAQRAAYNTAKVVKANPVKTALGATAVGAGAAYALSGDAKKPETEVVPPKVPGTVVPPKVPGQTSTPVPATPGATDVDDIKALTAEIDAIKKELMGSDGSAFQDDPEIQKAIADAEQAAGGASANQSFSG